MEVLIFILVVLFVCIGGFWLLSQFVVSMFFGKEKETYVDKSVHHNYYTQVNIQKNNKILINDEHKKDEIIDIINTLENEK